MVANVGLGAWEQVERLPPLLLSYGFILSEPLRATPDISIKLLREIVVSDSYDLKFELVAASQKRAGCVLDTMFGNFAIDLGSAEITQPEVIVCPMFAALGRIHLKIGFEPPHS
ncbi:hypothetical protein [Pseudomonas sp. 18058]|uniref:hypothetical protein n=1 Tax=Pseudomonas sp. 18058 TaxID=2681406 RepID=UPI00135C96E2|nr:hypothetical protein [Pseudomonas sp. 18058]